MVKWFSITFLLMIFLTLMTIIFGCKTRDMTSVNMPTSYFGSTDPIASLGTMGIYNNAAFENDEISDTTHEFEESNQKNIEEYEYSPEEFVFKGISDSIYEKKKDVRNTKKNCIKHNELFKTHFLVVPKIDHSDIWKNNHFTKNLYYFTPLFQNCLLKEMTSLITDQDIKEISNSYQRPYNASLSTYSNFDALLNHYAKILSDNTQSVLNVTNGDNAIREITLTIAYLILSRKFFDEPYGNTDIDNIVFNIMIPFKNKVDCILYNKKHHEYCKSCLNITNIFKCCSLNFYDLQTKSYGEVYIKYAAQILNMRLSRYMHSKGEVTGRVNVDCFYDENTMDICLKINEHLMRQNKKVYN